MQIFAHRGGAGEAPENTVAAIKQSIDRGVKAVEIDLRIAADGKFVVTHDNNAKRTTGVNRLIRNLSSQELYALDSRHSGPQWPNKRYCGIPSLQRYMRHSAALQCYQLELKTDTQREHPQFIELLKQHFPNKAAAKRVVITSFDYTLLTSIAEQLPWLKIGAITYKTEALAIAKSLNCDYFCIHESICNSAFIKKIANTDMHISVWTVNNPKSIEKCFKQGVDSIITDYPSMAIPFVSSLLREK